MAEKHLEVRRLILNNWGAAPHNVYRFEGNLCAYVGPSGSGKTTAIDAALCVLLASFDSKNFNQAKDNGSDGSVPRTTLSYCRGATKHHGTKREHLRFVSGIAMEWYNSETGHYVCTGAVLDIKAGEESNIPPHKWFIIDGPAPDDEFRNYTFESIEQLALERAQAPGRMYSCEVCPTDSAYRTKLFERVLGVDYKTFRMLTKSSVSMTFSRHVADIIKDFMFPCEPLDDVIEKVSDNANKLYQIRELLQDRKECLEALTTLNDSLTALNTASAKVGRFASEEAYIKSVLLRRQAERITADLNNNEKQEKQTETDIQQLENREEAVRNRLMDLKLSLQSSDYERRRERLAFKKDSLQNLLLRVRREYDPLMRSLDLWKSQSRLLPEDAAKGIRKTVDAFLAAPGEATAELMRTEISRVLTLLTDITEKQRSVVRTLTDEITVLETEIAGYKDDMRNYRSQKDLFHVRAGLEEALRAETGKQVSVDIFSRLFDVTADEWKNAVEGRLSQKSSLIVAPEYTRLASRILRGRYNNRRVRLIDSIRMVENPVTPKDGSLYDCVSHDAPDYVDAALRYYLGRIMMCSSNDDLSAYGNGVTKDCFSYDGRQYYHLNHEDYTTYASIGKEIPQSLIESKEAELKQKQEALLTEKRLLTEYLAIYGERRAVDLELDEMLDICGLPAEVNTLTDQIEAEEKVLESLKTKEIDKIKQDISECEDSIQTIKASQNNARTSLGVLRSQTTGLRRALAETEDAEARIAAEYPQFAEEAVADGNEWLAGNITIRNPDSASERLRPKRERLTGAEQHARERLIMAKTRFIQRWPSYGIDDTMATNDLITTRYEEASAQYNKDLLPKYEAAYKEALQDVRKNVINLIRGRIENAKRSEKEINQVLSMRSFGTSRYHLKVERADGAEGRFYDMLMDDRLKLSPTLNDAQISLGETDFLAAHRGVIEEFISLFERPKHHEDDSPEVVRLQERQYKERMRKYSDYRTYLRFNLTESNAADKDGQAKSVAASANQDSGGESINAKYVALLIGFVMLYRRPQGRNATPGVVIMDEAFLKLDKARSYEIFRYIRQLGLQVICGYTDANQVFAADMDSLNITRSSRTEETRVFFMDQRAIQEHFGGEEVA